MSGGIEEPYSIASLPKPLDSEHGRTHGATVFSVTGSKKRKRHEIAISVDGESVNIYNTQSQETASAYALPPQSYLAAPPCSIYCRRAKPLQPQRNTYLALHDGRNGQKPRLVSISETLGKPQSEEREPRAPTRRERKLRQGNITSLDVIGSGDDYGGSSSSISVLVSYSSGDVDCIPGDCSAPRWEHTRTGDSHAEVEFSCVVDLEAARKGLLKNREDVLATLGTTNRASAGTSTLPLLVQVIRSDSRRLLVIHVIRNASGQALQTTQMPLEQVLSYEIPFRHRDGAQEAQYELHAASGMLYQRLGGRLNVVDLSGTTPKLAFELGRKGNITVTSFTRLSAATVLVLSPGKIGVFDTKYGSTLSSLDYPSAQQGTEAATTDLMEQSTVAILAQFSDLNIVVGLSGASLVAWQVGDMLDDGRRAKAHGPLLLEVMGKGKVAHETFGSSKKQEKKREKWAEWTAKVDNLVSHADVEALEDLVAAENNIIDTNEDHIDANGGSNGYSNGQSRSRDNIWELEASSFDPQFVSRPKVSYLLAKVFRWQSDDSHSYRAGDHHLEIAVASTNILRWLAMAGYLTTSEVNLVLSDASPPQARSQVAPGDVIAAIGDADPSLKLMCDLLGLPVHWSLDDVVRGLQILIRTLDDPDESLAPNGLPKAITIGDEATQGYDAESELAVAVKEVDEVRDLLESGLAVRSEVCRLLLARLQSFSHKDVARTMRRTMSTDELIFFINMLRNELANGGWTQRYIEENSDGEDTFAGLGNAQDVAPSDQAIRTIANLCSCAIDAIGLSGWLVGRSASITDTHDFAKNLTNEVSFALQGLFQAEKLESLLMEVRMTAGSEQARSQKRKRQDEEEHLSAEQSMMPLGGRREPPVVGHWASKTTRKSKAAIAEQINRNIGKYTFERIRI